MAWWMLEGVTRRHNKHMPRNLTHIIIARASAFFPSRPVFVAKKIEIDSWCSRSVTWKFARLNAQQEKREQCVYVHERALHEYWKIY